MHPVVIHGPYGWPISYLPRAESPHPLIPTIAALKVRHSGGPGAYIEPSDAFGLSKFLTVQSR